MIKKVIRGIFRRITRRLRVEKFKLLSTNTYTGVRPYLSQPLLLMGQGNIEFEKQVKIGVSSSPNFWSSECYIEARKPNAIVRIGENTWINNGLSTIAEASSICIGKNCLIGHDVFIIDSNFHSLDYEKRRDGGSSEARSVFIGDNVFIGSRATILRNTVVGNGSVVASGSIVSGTFPERSLISGNPAKLIRIL